MRHTSAFLVCAAAVLQPAAARSSPLVKRTWDGVDYGCKCYFDDSCWPADAQWNDLNSTVDGNLILDVPPEAVCHDEFVGPLGTLSTYSAEECSALQATYADEQWT